MRIAPLALGVLLAAQPVAAQGRPDFEFHRDLAQGKRLYLQNIIGDVAVTGGSGRGVEITAAKKEGRHGNPADVTVETIDLDDGVAICVRYPGQGTRRRSSDAATSKRGNPCSSDNWGGNGDRNDTQVNFTVRVPAGLILRIGTVSGDINAEKLEGDLDLQSVSGDARLTGGTGPSINVETVSGDVDILDANAVEVSGHTISGEVSFRGPILANGSYDFATTSGDIVLTLPPSPNAKLSAATFSGRFSSDLPTSHDDTRRRRHRYDATWGTGSARLDVESLSGDIRITTSSR